MRSVFEVPGRGFVISENEVWRPGAYESRDAANLAFELDDTTLQILQDRVSPGLIGLAALHSELAGKSAG